MTRKTYSELIQFKTFRERYEYLKLSGKVGEVTFGYKRLYNQIFYRGNDDWLSVRNKIIIRDGANDLGLEGYSIEPKYIQGKTKRININPIIIHHINPITDKMLENYDPELFNPENLICVTRTTHNAIHYGDESQIPQDWTPRTENDTIPWR